MKKTLSLILALFLLAVCSGCGGPEKGYLTGNKMIDAYLEMPLGTTEEKAIEIMGEPGYTTDRSLGWYVEDEDNEALVSAIFEDGKMSHKSVDLYDLASRGFPTKTVLSRDKIKELTDKMTVEKGGAGITVYKDGLPYDEVASSLGCDGLFVQSLPIEDGVVCNYYIWPTEDKYSDMRIAFFDGILHSIEG